LLEAITIGTPALLAQVPGINPDIITSSIAASQVAYEKSFQIVYYAAIPFGVCCMLGGVFASNGIDDKLTSEVARKIKGTATLGNSKKEDEKV
jgi:hypothetical protein